MRDICHFTLSVVDFFLNLIRNSRHDGNLQTKCIIGLFPLEISN